MGPDKRHWRAHPLLFGKSVVGPLTSCTSKTSQTIQGATQRKANGLMCLAKNVIVEAERMFFIHNKLRPLLVVWSGLAQNKLTVTVTIVLQEHGNMKVYYL